MYYTFNKQNFESKSTIEKIDYTFEFKGYQT